MTNDGRKSILLVDDDEGLLRTMADFLAHEGFGVVRARDGKQALARMDAAVPDLMVLDISMPVMGGVEVLKRIQNPDGSMRCPVLVLTARAAMEPFFNGIAVDAFLAKPVTQEALISRVREILDAHDDTGKRDALTKRKVLIGEGDAARVESLQIAFRQAGFDTVVAKTGGDVLEKAIEKLPDAILMNEILTGMNGSVVASLVRIMPATRSIPVVLYDESRPATGLGIHAWTVPEGVVAVAGKSDALDLLKAVKKALGS
jgi:DNA-binding response OmpR family regulator